eukprot:8979329-Pyramimonas_sp.AAC.1
MLIAKLLIRKMRSARMSFLAKSYDMRNAFATGPHEQLVAGHTLRCEDEHFHPLLEQHRHEAV